MMIDGTALLAELNERADGMEGVANDMSTSDSASLEYSYRAEGIREAIEIIERMVSA